MASAWLASTGAVAWLGLYRETRVEKVEICILAAMMSTVQTITLVRYSAYRTLPDVGAYGYWKCPKSHSEPVEFRRQYHI